MSALDHQEGGNHYKDKGIQPAEFVHSNNIPYLEGSVIYYVARWRDKGGLQDIRKAIHTLQILLELEEKAAKTKKQTPDEFLAEAAAHAVRWLETRPDLAKPGFNCPNCTTCLPGCHHA